MEGLRIWRPHEAGTFATLGCHALVHDVTLSFMDSGVANFSLENAMGSERKRNRMESQKMKQNIIRLYFQLASVCIRSLEFIKDRKE